MEVTNPQIIPLQVLENQVCSECLLYLTVLPVTNTKSGITCGRHKSSDLDFSVPSLFNIVMPYYRFECANHFTGCDDLLDTNTSQQHELDCVKFEVHQCLFCSFNGSWCQILQHSLNEHPLSVKKNCKFNFKLGTESSQTLLYPENNTIYILVVNITCQKFTLTISKASKHNLKTIKSFKVTFSEYPGHSDGNKISLTDYSCSNNITKSYFEKDIEELILYYGLNNIIKCKVLLTPVELSEKALELEKRFALYDDRVRAQVKVLTEREMCVDKLNSTLENQKQSHEALLHLVKAISSTHFKCVQCGSYPETTIYFCPEKHYYCKKCLTSSCKACNNLSEFTEIRDLNKIIVSCGWPECNLSVPLSAYANHRMTCLRRRYKCPLSDCDHIAFSSKGLIYHWHSFNIMLRVDPTVELDKHGNYEYYWLIDGDLYHFIVKYQSGNVRIIIEHHNVISNPVKFMFYGYSPNYSWSQLNFAEDHLTKKCVLYSGNNNQNRNGYSDTKLRISFN